MTGEGDRSAVVIGASGGIGAAMALALEESGRFAVVHRFARSLQGAAHLDLLDEDSIAAAAAQVAKGPPPALIFLATGMLQEGSRGPEKALRDLDGEWLARSFAINAIGPALAAKHFLPITPKTERTVFAALSARVGSISDNRLGGWHGYRASKAALNMLLRTIAIEENRRNRRAVVLALHPGTVDTALSQPFQGGVPPERLFTADYAARRLLAVIEQADPDSSGGFFDYAGDAVEF